MMDERVGTVTVGSRNAERVAEIVGEELAAWNVKPVAAQEALLAGFRRARVGPPGMWPAPTTPEEAAGLCVGYTLTRIAREVGAPLESPFEPTAPKLFERALAELPPAK